MLVQAQERISVLENHNLKQPSTREKELVTIDTILIEKRTEVCCGLPSGRSKVAVSRLKQLK